MERQKKLLSLVLALVMLFTTAVVVVVAEEPTVTSTETATVTSSYKMFKVSSVATVNTMSDGTKTLDIIYPGSSFLKMYLGSAADAETATTDVYDAQELSDGTYKYTIPMPDSGNTITAAVLSSRGSWKDVTITVSALINTENVKVAASYKMFKVQEAAKLNTYSDGSQTVEFVYTGSSFLKMYLGTAEEAGGDSATATNFYSAQLVNDTYVYTIPVSDSDTIAAAVLSSKGSWKDNNMTIVKVTDTSDAEITASYSMFKVAEAAKINTYSDGSRELVFTYTGSSFLKLYLGTAEAAATAESDIYEAEYVSEKNYTYTIPMPESGDTITAAVLSSKGSWKDNTITVKYATDTKDVTASIDYDVFSIDQDVTLDVYNDGSMKGAVKYPDSAITKAYVGTATDAASADDSAIVSLVDGKFTIPVSALDTEIAVAVYNGTKWIDTTVMFTTGTDDDTTNDDTTNDDTTSDDTAGDDTTNDDTTGDSGTTGGNVTPNIIPTDGTYTIDVTSNATMFKVIACELEVVDGKITATVTLSGTGYDYMYAGTAADAAKASASDLIKYETDDNGKYTFTFEIDSLDKEIEVAAQSAKNDKWFDRTLVFDSSTLRLVTEGTTGSGTSTGTSTNTGSTTTTDKNENLSESEIESLLGKVDKEEVVSNGTYTPSFGFTGGSGRTNITCDKVVVKDGKATAAVVFDSENFTWVQVDGVKYYNQNEGGNSTFIIPINLNGKTSITAETVAMSSPHEVAYTLYCFIDGTKAPASTTPIEDVTEAEDEKAEDVTEDKNSWGSFEDEDTADNDEAEVDGDEGAGISAHIICIIIIVLLAAGVVTLLVSKKKRG